MEDANTTPGLQRITSEVERVAVQARAQGQRDLRRARTWSIVHLALGVPAVVLAALAGSILLAEWATSWLPGVLAIVAALLMGVSLGLAPARRARIAQEAGADFLALAGKARRLERVDLPVWDESQARSALDQLILREEELAHRAPAPAPTEAPLRRAA